MYPWHKMRSDSVSNYKTIGGGIDGIEDENVALQHQRARQNRKSGY